MKFKKELPDNTKLYCNIAKVIQAFAEIINLQTELNLQNFNTTLL